MHPLTPILISLACGLLLGAVAARVLVVRHARRERLADERARRAERLAELGSMTGGLAHEIKNPLSTIGLNAQLLAEGIEDLPEGELKPRLLSRVRALRRETERLRGILQDFLDYAGNVRLEKRPGDINRVVQDLADFFSPEAERHGVRLRCEITPGELRADFDERLLKQAVLNLMLNAVQAMGPSASRDAQAVQAPAHAGELILRTASAPPRAPRDASVQIHVIDTGPGMSPEVIDKIFKPYFTTKAGGTGLGLPTSRRLIEEHGGRLDVHSQPGVGTDFTVVLPV